MDSEPTLINASGKLWLGTWSIVGPGWGKVDAKNGLEVLTKAFASGFKHFDTALFYGNGLAERLLAKVYKKNRKQIFISTKGGLVQNNRQAIHQASYTNLQAQARQSLKNLKTDYIDLYSLHWPDPKIDINESIESLKDLKKMGLIKNWGLSNLTPNQVEIYCKKNSKTPHQSPYSFLRQSSETLIAGTKNSKCYNCIFSPLEQGLLSSYDLNLRLKELSSKDFRRKNHFFKNKEAIKVVSDIQKKAKTLKLNTDTDPVTSASLTWLNKQKAVDVIIVGLRKLSQLQTIDLSRTETKSQSIADLVEYMDKYYKEPSP